MTTQLFAAQTGDGQSSVLSWPGGFGTFVVAGKPLNDSPISTPPAPLGLREIP